MWWSGHKILEPTELESRFSNEDSLSNLGISYSEEMSPVNKEKLKRVKNLLMLNIQLFF